VNSRPAPLRHYQCHAFICAACAGPYAPGPKNRSYSVAKNKSVAYLRDASSDIAVEAMAARAGVVVRAISRFYRAARPRPGLMLGFSGFPRQLIVPAAARLAALVARRAGLRA
jgi:hypothetical protein